MAEIKTTSEDVMLKVENFSKTFSDIAVLKNISFEVKTGEFLVILGPSGSGKTTLLRVINGLTIPDSGAFHFKGEKVSTPQKKAELRKYFGMIFQHYNLVENLSVINNVLTGALSAVNHFLSLFYLFPKKLRLQALQCLDRVELLEKAYVRASELSGGQRQRAGIARAIIQKPSVILADEPISNLDPLIAYNIMMLLKDICVKDGISIICNLHQVDFALQFADRIICLVEGQIVLNKQVAELNSEIIYQAYKGNLSEVLSNS